MPGSRRAGYLFSSVVELVALRRVAPRPAAQRLPANRAVRASRSAAARGGVVAARQPLPLNRYVAHSFLGMSLAQTPHEFEELLSRQSRNSLLDFLNLRHAYSFAQTGPH